MSEVIVHPPGGRIEYTGAIGRVSRARGGPPIRHQPSASMQTRSTSGETYWRERRRHELAAERRRHPDLAVFGTVVPYGVPLDDQRGNRLMFTPETSWLFSSPPFVPVELEHGGALVGMAQLVEERSGLVIGDSTVYAASLKAVGDRRYLSVGLGEYHCRQRADGCLEVTTAELSEISLVRDAGWPDHCAAHIWPKTA